MAVSILVMDEDRVSSGRIRRSLATQGYDVRQARFFDEVLRLLSVATTDLLVIDPKSAGRQDLALLAQLRAHHPHLPMVAIVAWANTPDLVALANLGAIVVLEKPVEGEALLRAIQRLLPRPSGGGTPLPGSPGQRLQGGRGSYATTFPEPIHVSPASRSLRRFLHESWSRLREDPRLAWQVPPGSEFADLLREVARWGGFASADVAQYESSQWAGGASFRFRQAVEAMPRRLVVLSDSAAAPANPAAPCRACARSLLDWARACGAILLLRLPFTPVAGDPPTSMIEPDPVPPLTLPLLRDRPDDLAFYWLRLWSRGPTAQPVPQRISLRPDAIRLLLCHSWPGNYQELVTLVSYLRQVDRDGAIDAADLQLAFRRLGAELPSKPMASLARAWLKDRQTRCLQAALAHPDSPASVHAREDLGQDFRPGRSPADYPLLWPTPVAPPAGPPGRPSGPAAG